MTRFIKDKQLLQKQLLARIREVPTRLAARNRPVAVTFESKVTSRSGIKNTNLAET
jgi:hypothetical protein